MKVLVSGGSGFLGSHVADALSDAGHEVVIFDRRESAWSRADQQVVLGDVRDEAAFTAAAQGCDAIYHLAAIADLKEAEWRPREAVEVNVMGTVSALQAAREVGAHVVLASTIYVYSRQGSIYRTSKQASELLAEDFRAAYGVHSTILRFGSLYGPRADEKNAIRRLLSQAYGQRRIDYWGSGDEVREYIHVRDAAALAVEVLDPEFDHEIVHLTGMERMRTAEMLQIINEILGGDIKIRLETAHLPGHYVQTPYNYTPRLGRKLIGRSYIDLGLGLLECIAEIDPGRAGPDLLRGAGTPAK